MGLGMHPNRQDKNGLDKNVKKEDDWQKARNHRHSFLSSINDK